MHRLIALAVGLAFLPHGVSGQDESAAQAEPRAAERFRALVAARKAARSRTHEIDLGALKGTYEGLKDKRASVNRSLSLPAATDALDASDSSGAATVRKLAGAIKTNPEGTEAGLVVAPFLLAGTSYLGGLELTVATLEDDLTRFGGSYTWDRTRQLTDADYARLSQCPFQEPESSVERFYVAACTQVVASVPVSANNPRLGRARSACGLAAEPPMPDLVGNVREIAKLVLDVDVVAPRPPSPPRGEETPLPLEVRVAAIALREQARPLATWDFDHPYGCYDPADVEAFFRRVLWAVPKTKIALSVVSDHFPRKHGFSPDGSALPHGERSRWQARADASRSASRLEWGLGVGVGQSRSEPDEDFEGTVTPSLSVAHAFRMLPGRPLVKDGLLNLDQKGELPPHFVLGLSASAEVVWSKPKTQTTSFNEVKIQPYVDFFVTDKLSFRLGIPIKATIVKSKAQAEQPPVPPATEPTPAIEGRRSLQWTVPVAIVTVIKL